MNAKARELLKQSKPRLRRTRNELLAVAREIESRRTGIYRLSDKERLAVRKGLEAARRTCLRQRDRRALPTASQDNRVRWIPAFAGMSGLRTRHKNWIARFRGR